MRMHVPRCPSLSSHRQLTAFCQSSGFLPPLCIIMCARWAPRAAMCVTSSIQYADSATGQTITEAALSRLEEALEVCVSKSGRHIGIGTSKVNQGQRPTDSE
eukprot:GHVU01082708.1.p3 GENE.GHVU01082708.1~~GHVU01082708.1.p3  ORF type:complete len:102 (-),score=7.49 GHVU01082708.1:548-853(-)